MPPSHAPLTRTYVYIQVMHQFPLLRHHWPLVIKFQDQIAELAMQALSDNADPNATRVADAIVAIAFLRDLDSQQVRVAGGVFVVWGVFLCCRGMFLW